MTLARPLGQIVLILIGIGLVWTGSIIVRFEAEPLLKADRATWRHVPIVGSWSRLADPAPASTLQQRIAETEDALGLQPTSAMLWLRLADLYMQDDRLSPEILGAIDMASLTERREARSMLLRSLMIIRLWPYAGPSRKKMAVNHLVRLFERFQTPQIDAVRAVVLKLPKEEKDDMRRLMQAEPGVTDRMIYLAGLLD